ncbi:MAG TPA: sialidase family protein [Thermoanaerobaculia bacterium]|nr:sialidase family protein [Thermoanaerobaculia bacterium]
MRTNDSPRRARLSSRLATQISLFALGACWLGAAPAALADKTDPRPAGQSAVIQKANLAECALLDDAKQRGKMDGLLRSLLVRCGREHELGGVTADSPGFASPEATDSPVSDPSGDTPAQSHTQSETSIAVNETTGTRCAAWNDSWHEIGTPGGMGFSGFARSTDGGVVWVDQGPIGAGNFGDPAMVWRRMDGNFYYAALSASGGLSLFKSTDDCDSFTFMSTINSSGSDDKELMAVDNNPASPHYGNLYVAWTNFAVGGDIQVRRSTNAGMTWDAAITISNPGSDVQGAWPAVAPNGDVYVSWVRWNPFPAGPIDVEVVRSTNGGTSYSFVTNPLTGAVNPRDTTATSSCGRPALKGNIRYLPSPQIAVGSDGHVHVVYTKDPDATGSGDVVNVYYRKSVDNGTTWSTEFLVNDDATTTDQYQPSMSVSAEGVVTISYYSRQLDTVNNTLLDYYSRQSPDNGATFNASVRISDVSTPIFLDPGLATCYHGDYDTQISFDGFVNLIWSDDRNIQGGHNDPDIFGERIEAGIDFLVGGTPASQDICIPTMASYTVNVPQFQAFSEMVTLSTMGTPAGSTPSFVTNPVTPPGSTTLNIDTTGTSAGSSTITITGTSSPSAIVHSGTVTLNLFAAAPGSPTLTTPADNATNVVLSPTLMWGAVATATSYDVELASDAGFTMILFMDTVTGTSTTVDIALDPVTEYFWRVTASNVCGDSAVSSVFSFTTRVVPPYLLIDDDDNAPNVRATLEALLTTAGITYDVWDTVNSDAEPDALGLAPYHTVIWFTGDEFGGAAGPGAASETALATWLDSGQKCLFMDSQDYLFDRGVTTFATNYLGVAARTNDTNHTSMTGENFFTGLGPYALVYPFTNFSDSLTATAGTQVAFRGNVASAPASLNRDGGVWRTVFFTVPIEAISNATDRQNTFQRVLDYCIIETSLIFADGFETGDTSAWTVTFP